MVTENTDYFATAIKDQFLEHPEDLKAKFEFALSLIALDPDAAQKILLSQFIATGFDFHPAFDHSLGYIGICLMLKQDYTKALAYFFKQATIRCYECPDSLENAAACYLNMGGNHAMQQGRECLIRSIKEEWRRYNILLKGNIPFLSPQQILLDKKTAVIKDNLNNIEQLEIATLVQLRTLVIVAMDGMIEISSQNRTLPQVKLGILSYYAPRLKGN